MLNRLCCPELSFNSGTPMEPYAYVLYDVDGEKDSVPLSFISNFPATWRTPREGSDVGWDKRYLYKVFWSSIENDSPKSMLGRVPQIPVYESGAGREKPGYYRAAVLAVKENEHELNDLLNNGKRISVGVSKYMYSSFDSKSEAQSSKDLAPKVRNTRLRGKARESSCSSNQNSQKKVFPKLSQLKKKKVKVLKKKGINLQAQSSNMNSLKATLIKRYPLILPSQEETSTNGSAKTMEDDKVLEEEDEDQSPLKINKKRSAKVKDSESDEASHSEDFQIVRNCDPVQRRGVDSSGSVDNDDSGKKTKEAHVLSHSTQAIRTPKQNLDVEKDENLKYLKSKRSGSGGSRRSMKETSSSSSETDLSDGSKRIKIDPDFTPRKYARAKEEIASQKGTIQRIFDLNLKLQEKVNLLENKNSSLEIKVMDLEVQLSKLKNDGKKISKDTVPLVHRKQISRHILFSEEDKSTPIAEHFSRTHSLKDLSLKSNNLVKENLRKSPGSSKIQTKKSTFSFAIQKVLPENLKGGNGVSSLKSSPAAVKQSATSVNDESPKSTVAKQQAPATFKHTGNLSSALQESDSYSPESINFTDVIDNEGFDFKQEASPFEQTEDLDITKSPPSQVRQHGLETLCETVMPTESDNAPTDGPLKLCKDVVIPAHIRKLIWSAKAGEKKDVKFIKELAIVAFGPEVLASRTIMGSLRGNASKKVKDDDPNQQQSKKDPLDKEILQAVREKLIERVSKELNKPLAEVEDLPRCHKTRFNNAVRDAQKRCRHLGYGNGLKTNDLTAEVLKAD